MGVAGDHHVHRGAHLARLVDDLADAAWFARPATAAGVGEHHDRLHAAALQLRHQRFTVSEMSVKRNWRRELRAGSSGVSAGRHADEADLDAGALDDLVGRQDRLAAVAA